MTDPDARTEVAHAVRRALSKHGYAGLTTEQIAAETDKSESFLFYHYDSKDDLVVAFLEESVGWLSERLEGIDEENPDARMRKLCATLLVDPRDEEMRGLHVAVMELLSHAPHNDSLREPLETYQRYVRDALADEIRTGVERGIYRDVDPDATASFLQMVLDGSTGSVLALEMDDVREDVHDRLWAYLDGLKRGAT